LNSTARPVKSFEEGPQSGISPASESKIGKIPYREDSLQFTAGYSSISCIENRAKLKKSINFVDKTIALFVLNMRMRIYRV
jgi:hypothetical protein